ncbi:MAG TPA: SDR family NAD(P)-dependent oxidoreductase [Polyangiaceae bacterium]|jgi:NAD(P)-dependent dehydrogenase (short-subunit alcohol dehydrogenase family)|nr:SDR family NAD(P)-dependent oxidoreductase [Polyangiaceae bacterium]
MTPVNEQVVLVTGATDGHGKGVALELARRGATVLVHGRDDARIAATLKELAATGNTKGKGYRADLASLAEVRALGAAVLAGEKRLDALVNNAGIGTTVPGGGVRAVSRDGVEMRFAVNYLAPFLLTRLLLPLIKSSAPARIVHVSSLGQQAIDFDDVMLEGEYSGVRAYCQSKLAQILETIDEAEELRDARVTVNALHPATYMPTKIVPSPMSSLEEGVEATVRLVVDPSLDATSGRFFNGLRDTEASEQAYDGAARKKLRALSARLTGVT